MLFLKAVGNRLKPEYNRVMEKMPLLIKPAEKLKSPRFYVEKEMGEDLDLFLKEEREPVSKFLARKSLEREEMTKFQKAQHRWWKEKYGFPFDLRKARDELLLRKYDPEKTDKIHQLQCQLLKAMERGNEEKIAELKDSYLKDYPDQLEGVEVILGLRHFFSMRKENTEKKIRREKIADTLEEVKKKFINLTEYQFLFTHFILENRQDREFLNNFWELVRRIGEATNTLHQVNILQRGLLSQAAAYQVMEKIGDNPRLSHPSEDAFDSIDLWTEGDTALQIKGWEEEVPAVFRTEEIAFPAVEMTEGQKKKFYNSAQYLTDRNLMFRAKVAKYAQTVGKEVEGHMMVIPYSKIDFITGEPAPELVEFFKEKIKKERKEAQN